MRTFKEMLSEYKSRPNDSLKDEIINRLLQIEDPEELDRLTLIDKEEWVVYAAGLFVKRLYDRTFAAAECYEYGGDKYICFGYRFDLDNYSPAQLDAYLENGKAYEWKSPDDDYQKAVSIVVSMDESDALEKYIAAGREAYDNWLDHFEKEVC